jgi:hypothetical protein
MSLRVRNAVPKTGTFPKVILCIKLGKNPRDIYIVATRCVCMMCVGNVTEVTCRRAAAI